MFLHLIKLLNQIRKLVKKSSFEVQLGRVSRTPVTNKTFETRTLWIKVKRSSASDCTYCQRFGGVMGTASEGTPSKSSLRGSEAN
jgi:hypothetical protein